MHLYNKGHACLNSPQVAESIQSNLPMDFWTIDLRSVLIALGEVSGDEVGICVSPLLSEFAPNRSA